MYVCVCNSITDCDLAALLATPDFDPERLAERLGLDSEDCCGQCAEDIDYLIRTAESERCPGVRRKGALRLLVRRRR